ncbi:MAG: SGNH/GDSL hydrolase family protein [Myxococcota bacterium]
MNLRVRTLPLSIPILGVLIALASLAVTIPASAHDFSAVYSFGDSFTDPGILGSGRSTEGPLWIEVLGDRLGLPKAGMPSALGGDNYARTPGTVLDTGWPGLASQVSAFQAAHPAADPDALYVIFIGMGDLDDGVIVARQDPSDAIVAGIVAAVESLADSGAEKFLVGSLWDRMRSPVVQLAMAGGILDADDVAYGLSLFEQVNQKLDIALAALPQTIHRLDAYTLSRHVALEAELMGFPEGLQICWNSLSSDPRPESCPGHAYFDWVHPAADLHSMLAARALRALEPELAPDCDPALDGSEHPASHCRARVRVQYQGSDPDPVPVPCARLRTKYNVLLETDQNGVATLFEPGLMGSDHHLEFVGPTGYALAGSPNRLIEEGGERVVTLQLDAGATPEPAACTRSSSETALALAPVAAPGERFRIRVEDAQTGRPVPRVAVSSPAGTRYTDNLGVVAFHDAGLMGQTDVPFEIASAGYELASSPGGLITLDPVAGGQVTLAMERKLAAQRLYRMTGVGRYRESSLLGDPLSDPHPFQNARVAGQDSVRMTPYEGELFWIFGDTPLTGPGSVYHTSAARSAFPDPETGVDLAYYAHPSGTARGVADISGSGFTWLGGLVAVPDADGVETLTARYLKVNIRRGEEDPEELFFDIHRAGLAVLDESDRFKDAKNETDTFYPSGHPTRFFHDGSEYVYFAGAEEVHPAPPGPLDYTQHHGVIARTPPTLAGVTDPSAAEYFTAWNGGVLEKDANGHLVYAWRSNTRPVTDADVDAAPDGYDDPVPASEHLHRHMRNVDDGRDFAMAQNSVHWNAHRGRFVRIATELHKGDLTPETPSALGETWYAEADTIVGPWVYSRKVVTQDAYNFYQPAHFPEFDADGGREIFFMGTYTQVLAGKGEPTPHYEYNQMMYKLALDDDRLILPVPVYDVSGCSYTSCGAAPGEPAGDFVTKPGVHPLLAGPPPLTFFAEDRLASEARTPARVALSWSSKQADRQLLAGTAPAGEALFYGIQADAYSDAPGAPNPPPADHIGLYAWTRDSDGVVAYGVEGGFDATGYTRAATPLAWVWRNPIEVRFPVTDYLDPSLLEADADGDGVPDLLDNCSAVANADQLDVNGDGFGNLCDADYDQDGFVDEDDSLIYSNALGSCTGWSTYVPEADHNGNGCVDLADYLVLSSHLGSSVGPSGLSCAIPYHDGTTPCAVPGP